jgi:hypothetical protein
MINEVSLAGFEEEKEYMNNIDKIAKLGKVYFSLRASTKRINKAY